MKIQTTTHAHGNLATMAPASLSSWEQAGTHHLTQHRVIPSAGNEVEDTDGRRFINMVSCSYLALDRHPLVVEGATEALQRAGALLVPTSRARVGQALISEAEAATSQQFGCETIITLSCFNASAGVLPLLAAGILTDGVKPVMAFDKRCHFSMAAMRAACGNETPTLTVGHHDLDALEELCRRNPRVAYIADGAHSLGGHVPIEALLYLQDRYGLFLYLDDSHSLSVYGTNGVGYVRSHIPTLSPHTIVVASLGKAYGAAGGVIMLGDPAMRSAIEFVGGPLGWSQTATSATLGAITASAAIHMSPELPALQQRLRDVMERFDQAVVSTNPGDEMPIRLIELPDAETAFAVAESVLERGFYTSAVFFPIVARDSAGLRVMCRVDLSDEDLTRLNSALTESIALVEEQRS